MNALLGRPTLVFKSLDDLVLPDRYLTVTTLLLVMIGLVAMSSASVDYAEEIFGSSLFHVQRFLAHLAIGLTVACMVYAIPSSFWRDTGWIWLFVGLTLLILVLVPGIGREVNGSQRWVSLGPLNLQCSEIAKFCVVVYLAGYLMRKEHEVRQQWQGFVKPMLVLFCMTLLLMLEPDFGATVVIVATAFGMLFLAGVRLSHFLLVVCSSLVALVGLVVSEPYRMKRLTAFTDPWADQFDSGYQLTQSLIAFGQGEWFGVGLGNSVQKLFYLPEAHTDFVFSIWAEETGLVGAIAVLSLYGVLVARILMIARRAAMAGDMFGQHLCNGVAFLFATQVFINVGVSTGLLPTKGLALPFLSYGGSSLMASLCLVALVLRVALENDADNQRRTSRG
ncbi:MAG: cell division protein FtsW [Halieaceae bacterium]